MHCLLHESTYSLYTLLTTDPPKEALNNSSFYIVNNDFDNFSKKWFEVEIQFPSYTFTSNTSASHSPSPPPSFNSFKKGLSPYYMGFDYNEETYGMKQWSCKLC